MHFFKRLMKQTLRALLLIFLFCNGLKAQNVIKGIIKDDSSEQSLQGVLVSIENTELKFETTLDGSFLLDNIPNGKQMLTIFKSGYETQNYPVEFKGQEIDLGTIFMYKEELIEDQEDLGVVIITDDELNDDTSAADNISGLLQASRDVFLRTAAFDWSGSFFRIRGLDSENGKVLINGMEMNKLYNGRPQWNNWGGLNDVTRNQEFSNYLTPSNYAFGGALGSTQITTRASEYRKGGRIAYASSNRSYVHRLMATYSSGVLEGGWAFTFSGSRRMANEGFVDGTSYNSYSMFGSVEKKINDKHSLNLTSIYAFNRRGKSAANTQEVYDLKGIKYNPYWGYQEGEIRNSRIREIEEPILMLNHYWDISDNTSLTTGVAYQFGGVGNSRLDYNGAYVVDDASNDGDPVIAELSAINPDPTYWQKLPSYALSQGFDAYASQESFLNDGQLDWEHLYRANNNFSGNSAFLLYDDRNEDKRLALNTILESQVTDNITLNASIQYINQESENFAEVIDLLGSNGFLDVDTFSDSYTLRQNNLLNPDFLAKEGDKIKYHYNLNSEIINGYAQAQFKFNKVDFFLAGNAIKTSHQREGFFQNGRYEDNSLGKSEKLEFTNFSGKAGVTYKIDGRNFIDVNGAYITKAPHQRNIFFNSRENNEIVPEITDEKVFTGDFSYILRSPTIQAKATAFYTKIEDATDVSFFFAGGGLGDFLQEILTNVDKQHIGVELGLEAKLTSALKLRGAANIGQYTYANNPNLFLASEAFQYNFLESSLKNYKLSSGPQKVYSIGFEYRDPEYWWFAATANFFNDTYIDVAPLSRTNSFYFDGINASNDIEDEGFVVPEFTDFVSDYNEETAIELLQQERFDDYMVINLVGGKSWKIGSGQYIGFFASVGNLLNKEYKSGGYEQGRLANYSSLLEDNSLDKRLFGNKYWYGRGTTYFLNINYRF